MMELQDDDGFVLVTARRAAKKRGNRHQTRQLDTALLVDDIDDNVPSTDAVDRLVRRIEDDK